MDLVCNKCLFVCSNYYISIAHRADDVFLFYSIGLLTTGKTFFLGTQFIFPTVERKLSATHNWEQFSCKNVLQIKSKPGEINSWKVHLSGHGTAKLGYAR